MMLKPTLPKVKFLKLFKLIPSSPNIRVFIVAPWETIKILSWIRQVMPKGIEIKGFFVQKKLKEIIPFKC